MNQEVDMEHRLSRQIYSIGASAQAKLSQARILLLGLDGVGAEIAKNLVLMGVARLDICDDGLVNQHTPSTNFLIRRDDVGKNVVDAALAELRSMSPTVQVSAVRAESLGSYSVYAAVVVAGWRNDLHRLSSACHQQGVPFIVAQVHGNYSRLFCDFGPDHQVTEDVAFEFRIIDAKPSSESETDSLVRVLAETDEVATLYQGQRVVVSGTKSPDQLVEVVAVNARERSLTLRIPTTSLEAKDSLGVYIKENPRVTRYSHASLADVLQKPLADRRPRSRMDHTCFLALDAFMAQRQHVPQTQEEIDELAALLVSTSQGQIDAQDARRFAHGCRGEMPPLAGVLGGLAAQEVVKCVSGKGHPINQLHYHSEPALVSFGPTAGVLAIGKELQEKLANLRVFLVGCGAIGCEELKDFALLGIASGDRGVLHATDPDHIEVSNLSRQFLFRDEHVKRSKSEVALESMKRINPCTKVVAHDAKVGPSTEDRFSASFFDSLDVVCNALDNFDARYYIDRRCTVAKKPLIDPGTEGMALSLKVIIPWVTNTFSDQVPQERQEKSIPICTLRSFPTKSEHTLMWAKDRFALHFTKSPSTLQAYLRGEAVQPTDAKQLLGFWRERKLFSIVDCILWARSLFEDSFTSDIECLLKLHPPASRTETGELFWNDSRLQPSPLRFDLTNIAHMNFVVTAAKLKAITLGLNQEMVRTSDVAQVLLRVPEAWNRYPAKYTWHTKAEEVDVMDVEQPELDYLARCLQAHVPQADDASKIVAYSQLQAVDFEKDDDLHMQFITAAANLRSQNYNIRTLEMNDARRVVGKIIPAIVTTTAVAAGLATLELLKLVNSNLLLQHADHDQHKLKLAQADVSMMQEYSWLLSRPMSWNPMPVQRNVKGQRFGNTIITAWDTPQWPDMTLRSFIQNICNKYGAKAVDSIRTQAGGMIYFPFFNPSHTQAARLYKRMTELWEITKEDGVPTPKLLHFIVAEDGAEPPEMAVFIPSPTQQH